MNIVTKDSTDTKNLDVVVAKIISERIARITPAICNALSSPEWLLLLYAELGELGTAVLDNNTDQCAYEILHIEAICKAWRKSQFKDFPALVKTGD